MTARQMQTLAPCQCPLTCTELLCCVNLLIFHSRRRSVHPDHTLPGCSFLPRIRLLVARSRADIHPESQHKGPDHNPLSEKEVVMSCIVMYNLLLHLIPTNEDHILHIDPYISAEHPQLSNPDPDFPMYVQCILYSQTLKG